MKNLKIHLFNKSSEFLSLSSRLPSVSQAIQTINEAVDNRDASQTLTALRSPAAGVYGVTPECAQIYQDDLYKIKEDKKQEGEIWILYM